MRRLAIGIVALVGLAIVVVLLAGWLLLRASLPLLDGEHVVAGLAAPVSIERDALGVITLQAQSRIDAAYASGFVHAQDRFFQMDLQRRAGAGELAALLGPALVETDRYLRVHRFAARAQVLAAAFPPHLTELFEAYTAGVNDGLRALGARPFEYLVLGVQPRPWRVEDTLLTMYSMWFELNDETAERESQLGLLRDRLPASVYAWLIQSGTEWDAPLVGEPVPAAPLPPASDFDLRTMPPGWFEVASRTPLPARADIVGSNNWAVAASRSADGSALLAGDMHLGLRVPNIWYRIRMVIAEDGADMTGVMLTGAPLLIAGSNGHVAWAYTNSYGDWQDLVELDVDASDSSRYRAADGWREFDVHEERIEVRRGEPVSFEVRETIWGPVIDEDHRGVPRALRWSAHDTEATVADLTRMERAGNLDAAIHAASRIGIPPQNVVIADRSGRIGWTVTGRIPVREGIDKSHPSTWTDGRGWRGYLAPEDYPRIVDPPDGALWTANARTVDGGWLDLIGEGHYPPGARAGQIRDALLSDSALTLDDMLRIQLDDRALFLSRWRDLLLQVLQTNAPQIMWERLQPRTTPQQRSDLADALITWATRATTDSVAYRYTRAFHDAVHAALMRAWLAPVIADHEDFALTRHDQLERPVWQALTQRPAHLLDPRYRSWDEWLAVIVSGLLVDLDAQPGGIDARTWGERNTVRVDHPLAAALPVVGRWLRMPARPLPGDADMPRVQGIAFGASQRMAVSPGREHEGYFHMPGGQSGHPLSPFFGAGHDDWAEGRPTPFLPGRPVHRLELSPR